MTNGAGVTNLGLVPIEGQKGQVLIPPGPLSRLNYFDGKFLRAVDLKKEQDYLRVLIETTNLGGCVRQTLKIRASTRVDSRGLLRSCPLILATCRVLVIILIAKILKRGLSCPLATT